MRKLFSALTCSVALAVATPAVAHHSYAMFDEANPITIVGTVKQFDWVNPHTIIWINVPDGKGANQVWGVEGMPLRWLYTHGWTRTAIKPGDKVSLLISPLKDGRKGGGFQKLTFVDTGKVLLQGLSAEERRAVGNFIADDLKQKSTP